MPKKLFVGNLSFTSTEESIRALFSQHGEVLSVKIPTDQMSGRPRGFCFVEMENADEAMSKLNNVEFEGRTLKVDLAQERAPRKEGGFGGGGRGREGGYGGGGGGHRDHGGKSGGFGGGGNRNDRW
jgi:cold-inducible RNA-binding protein